METVGSCEAKALLPALLRRVENGEEVIYDAAYLELALRMRLPLFPWMSGCGPPQTGRG